MPKAQQVEERDTRVSGKQAKRARAAQRQAGVTPDVDVRRARDQQRYQAAQDKATQLDTRTAAQVERDRLLPNRSLPALVVACAMLGGM